MDKNTGIVKFFNAEKGFGFIKVDNSSEEIFVHSTGLIDQVKEGDRVEFNMKPGPKGKNADGVKKLQ